MKFIHGENLKLLDKKTIFIDKTVKIGKNVVIYENNRIEGDTEIGDDVIIKPNCYIKNCKIGNGTTFNYSQAEDGRRGYRQKRFRRTVCKTSPQSANLR